MRKALIPLLILLMGAGAPALSTWLYYSKPPAERTNFGVLVGPALLPDALSVAQDDPEAGGKWTLALADDAACALDRCRQKLCLVRFLSRSRPEAEFRTERVFWAAGEKDFPREVMERPDCGRGSKEIAAQAEPVDVLDGVRTVRHGAGELAWLRAVGGAEPEGQIFLVDPEGRLMMRYDSGSDPYMIAKDLKRLLRLSRRI